WLGRPAVHARPPFTVVDAITSLIQEEDGHRRPRVYNLAQLLVLQPPAASEASAIRVGTIEPTEHRHASHTRERSALFGSRRHNARVLVVARASPNPSAVSAIVP